jgi:integrase/recombinase XerD
MFEQFIKERQYLQNVSPRTIQWYRESFKWLGNPNPSRADLKDFVIRMREKGLNPASCNNRIRAVSSYLHWNSGSTEQKCSTGCQHLRIPKLKEEHRVLPTFTVEDIKKIAAWKPKDFYGRRLHTVLLALADTGCRIDELLTLKWSDVDMDNLLLTVMGKGSRQRRIPFSFELRKHLCRFKHEHQLVFPTLRGKKLGRREVLRDCKRLCGRLGIQVPERTLHAFRHTFAVNYLRRGGSVFHLQKCLGHASLDMTRRYANLMTEDLQKIHQQVSLLAQ